MQIKAKEFLNTLAVAGQLVDKRPTPDHPLRGCVGLVATGQALTIVSSDLEHYAELSVPVVDGPREPESIAVPFRALNALLAGPAKRNAVLELTISTTDAEHPVLSLDVADLSGRKPEWLCGLLALDPVRVGVVDSSALRVGLQRVLPAVNPKHHNVALRRIAWDGGELIATDGHRLHRAKMPIVGSPLKPALLSDVIAKLLVRMLPKEAPVVLQIWEDQAVLDGDVARWLLFCSAAGRLAIRMQEFIFARWHGAAEDAVVGVHVIVGREDLLEAIEGEDQDTGAFASVLLTTHGLRLDVVVGNEVMGRRTSVPIHGESPLRPGRGVRLQTRYLHDALVATSSPLVQLTFSGPLTPMRVASAQGDGTDHALMPMTEFEPALVSEGEDDMCLPGLDETLPLVVGQLRFYEGELRVSTDDGDIQWLTRRVAELHATLAFNPEKK